MLLHDFHLHTRFSADSRGKPRDYCLRALERGYTAICFTDHADFEKLDSGYGYFDYDEYRRAVEDCRREFAGSLYIGLGVEIDYHHSWEDEIKTFMQGKDFDFVLGSVHYLDDHVLVMEERHFAGKDQRRAYEDYFSEVLRLAQTGICQGIAHLDMIKRAGLKLYGPYEARAYRNSLEPIFEAMFARGLSMEINLSGYRQGLGGPLPGLDLLDMYAEAGGNLITIGSDAHRAGDACPDLPQIWGYVESNGFTLRRPRGLAAEEGTD